MATVEFGGKKKNLVSFLVKLVDLDPQTRDKLGQDFFFLNILWLSTLQMTVEKEDVPRGEKESSLKEGPSAFSANLIMRYTADN